MAHAITTRMKTSNSWPDPTQTNSGIPC
jgi:hypothetical protein